MTCMSHTVSFAGLLKVRAPRTSWNFVELCQRGYYDGTRFHRLVPGFMVQGGDPSGDGTGGVSAFGKPFADEFDVSPCFSLFFLCAVHFSHACFMTVVELSAWLIQEVTQMDLSSSLL